MTKLFYRLQNKKIKKKNSKKNSKNPSLIINKKIKNSHIKSPCYPLFTKMLDHFAYQYENKSSQSLTQFIERLMEKPLPAPGDTLEVDLSLSNSSSNSSSDKWRFMRPNEEDSLFEYVLLFFFFFLFIY